MVDRSPREPPPPYQLEAPSQQQNRPLGQTRPGNAPRQPYIRVQPQPYHSQTRQPQTRVRIGEDRHRYNQADEPSPTAPSVAPPAQVAPNCGPRGENIPLLPHRHHQDRLSSAGLVIFLICACSVVLSFGFNTAFFAKMQANRAENARLTTALDLLHRQRADELAGQKVLRQSWSNEAAKQELLRQSWQLEAAKQEALRRSWREEAAKHDAECLRKADKRLREEEQRDEEERAHMHLHWDGPHPELHCWGSGTREYTGRLWNIADGYNWTRACEKTPAIIHGDTFPQPSWCDIPNAFSGVIGHWIVSYNEKECETSWGKFFEKECTDNGRRRIESRLWNVHKGEDAYRLCSTASANVLGVHYDHPTYCFERENDKAMIAIWEIEDSSC